MVQAQPFDPTRYLITLGRSEYLEVKHRLVWLRSDHPNAHILTELVTHQKAKQKNAEGWEAIFKATVTIPGGGEASGWGTVHSSEFGDYIEKAETKAIGRALGALGYGTQFTEEFVIAQEPPEPEPDIITILAEALVTDVPDRYVTDEEADLVRRMVAKVNHSGRSTYEEMGKRIAQLTGGEAVIGNLSITDANTLVSELQALLDG